MTTDTIEGYLNNPTKAIASARECVSDKHWSDGLDENIIYDQLSSGEFRLYEEIILN